SCAAAATGSASAAPMASRARTVFRTAVMAVLIALRDEAPALQRAVVVIGALHGALGQLDLLARRLLVGNDLEQLRDAVETRAPLVVGGQDVPRRLLRVGGLQHHVAGARIVEPALPRGQIHGRELPLAQRILHAGLETPLLLLVPHLQPE